MRGQKRFWRSLQVLWPLVLVLSLAPAVAFSRQQRKPAAAESPLPGLVPELVTELKGAAREGVQVGDRLEIAIKIPESVGGLWTAAPLPGGYPLRDLGWEVRTVEVDPKNPSELRLRAFPLQPGMLELPPLQIADSDGRVVGKSQSIKVPVRSGIAEPSPAASGEPAQPEAAPVRPPVHLEKPFFLRAAPWIVQGGLVVLLIAGIVLIVRRGRRYQSDPKEWTAPTLPHRSYEKEALEALRRLDEKNWITQGELTKHYYAASRVLRRFLGEIYRFDAEESTTHEVLDQMSRASDLSSDRMAKLRELLSEMDRVKYAKDAPDSNLAQSLTQRLRGWISREGEPRAL